MKPSHANQTVWQLKRSIECYKNLIEKHKDNPKLKRIYNWRLNDAQKWLNQKTNTKKVSEKTIKQKFNSLISQPYNSETFNDFVYELRTYIQDKS